MTIKQIKSQKTTIETCWDDLAGAADQLLQNDGFCGMILTDSPENELRPMPLCGFDDDDEEDDDDDLDDDVDDDDLADLDDDEDVFDDDEEEDDDL